MNIQQMAEHSVARFLAAEEAARRAASPAAQQQLEAQVNASRFRELVSQHALLHGVRPSAVRHVVRDAETVFELRDGELQPRDGATDPGDPLSPLTPTLWLQQLAKSDGYLFSEAGRAH